MDAQLTQKNLHDVLRCLNTCIPSTACFWNVPFFLFSFCEGGREQNTEQLECSNGLCPHQNLVEY